MEAGGSLDDAAEMSLAHARRTSDQDRMLERARLLAQRLGLMDEWARLRTGLWVAGGLLGVLAFLLAGGLLTRALGSGQTVLGGAVYPILAVGDGQAIVRARDDVNVHTVLNPTLLVQSFAGRVTAVWEPQRDV